MRHLVLLGDSIFDNAGYVGKGESVTDVLSSLVGESTNVSLLAVDGDVTADIFAQLNRFPKDATHVFISCGGNDALRQVDILNKHVSSVGDAMELLSNVIEKFRSNYQSMLSSVLKLNHNVTLCTVYNTVPGISTRALSVLALFNEIILIEAVCNRLPVLDLRVLCSEVSDYSEVSPIEPSGKGAVKIAEKIKYITEFHEYGANESRVYA